MLERNSSLLDLVVSNGKDSFETEQQHHQDDNLPHMTQSNNEDDERPMWTVHRCLPERPSRWLDDLNDLDQDVGDCEINVLSQCNNCNAQEIGSLPTSGTAAQMMTLDKQWTQSTTLNVPSIRCAQQWERRRRWIGSTCRSFEQRSSTGHQSKKLTSVNSCASGRIRHMK